MGSADFSQFVVTTANETACETSTLKVRALSPHLRPPRLRCALFPLIHLPHLLVLPATFGLHRFWPTYPYFPALYVVSVRQAKGLPSASFRFHLTVDTLAVQLCTSSLPTCTRDFHPLERAHGAQTKDTALCKLQKAVYLFRSGPLCRGSFMLSGPFLLPDPVLPGISPRRRP